MEKRSHYIIQFASLPPGLHHFEFHIADLFFQPFEASLINKADVTVGVTLEKGSNNLQLTFDFKGLIHVTCVRCLDEFDIEVNEQRHLLVRQIEEVSEVAEVEEDIISIPHSANEIDLVPHLYDYLNLMVPLNPIHADKEDGTLGCNQQTLDEMRPEAGVLARDASAEIRRTLGLRAKS